MSTEDSSSSLSELSIINRKLSSIIPLKVATDRATHLKYSVWYSDGKSVVGQRGYFLSVYPIKRDGHFETAYMYSGRVRLISECRRYSDKDLRRFWNDLRKSDPMFKAVLNHNSLEVDDEQLL